MMYRLAQLHEEQQQLTKMPPTSTREEKERGPGNEVEVEMPLVALHDLDLHDKGALSRTFFDFFSKTAPKLRLSTFNHTGNAPRT